ncbi:MAG: hypothetical protein U0235_31440 [Polyangiaceae bacterium]
MHERVAGAYVMPPLEKYELALEVVDGFAGRAIAPAPRLAPPRTEAMKRPSLAPAVVVTVAAFVTAWVLVQTSQSVLLDRIDAGDPTPIGEPPARPLGARGEQRRLRAASRSARQCRWRRADPAISRSVTACSTREASLPSAWSAASAPSERRASSLWPRSTQCRDRRRRARARRRSPAPAGLRRR